MTTRMTTIHENHRYTRPALPLRPSLPNDQPKRSRHLRQKPPRYQRRHRKSLRPNLGNRSKGRNMYIRLTCTRNITPKSLFKGRSGGLKDGPYPISRATVVFFFSFIEKINKLNIYFLANRFSKIDRQLKDIKDANQSHVDAYDDAIEMVNGFEERLKAVHRTARYAQMKVDDLVKKYIEDIKNLKVIVTRQENTLQAMDLRLARAMRIIHMLTHPLLNSKFKKKNF